MGFGVPVGRWMRNELRPEMEDVLLSSEGCTAEFFRPQAIRRLLQSHCEGGHDYSFQLWALFWFAVWHREFLDH